MNFETYIKDWVILDTKIKKQSEELKLLREKRQTLGSSLNVYIEENELNNAIIQISDGTIKYNQVKMTQPLTLKYIHTCLENCIQNVETVDKLMEYIKENRDVKISNELKRYYNK
mgnify:FL=1